MFVITTLIPLVGCITLHYGIGGRIKDLSIGVVNHEVSFADECFNSSLITSEVRGFDCSVFKASCRFIHEIDDEILVKVKFFYKPSA